MQKVTGLKAQGWFESEMLHRGEGILSLLTASSSIPSPRLANTEQTDEFGYAAENRCQLSTTVNSIDSEFISPNRQNEREFANKPHCFRYIGKHNVPGRFQSSSNLLPGYSPRTRNVSADTIAGGLSFLPRTSKPFVSQNNSTYGFIPELFLGSIPINGVPASDRSLPQYRHINDTNPLAGNKGRTILNLNRQP